MMLVLRKVYVYDSDSLVSLKAGRKQGRGALQKLL